MRSFEYLGQIALSLILLIVLTVLPLAPVLASELNVEETPEDTSTEVVVSDISGEEKAGEDFDMEEVVDETEQATDSGETISELEVQEELLDFGFANTCGASISSMSFLDSFFFADFSSKI